MTVSELKKELDRFSDGSAEVVLGGDDDFGLCLLVRDGEGNDELLMYEHPDGDVRHGFSKSETENRKVRICNGRKTVVTEGSDELSRKIDGLSKDLAEFKAFAVMCYKDLMMK